MEEKERCTSKWKSLERGTENRKVKPHSHLVTGGDGRQHTQWMDVAHRLGESQSGETRDEEINNLTRHQSTQNGNE